MTKDTENFKPEDVKKIERIIRGAMGPLRAELGYQNGFISTELITHVIDSHDWFGFATELLREEKK